MASERVEVGDVFEDAVLRATVRRLIVEEVGFFRATLRVQGTERRTGIALCRLTGPEFQRVTAAEAPGTVGAVDGERTS